MHVLSTDAKYLTQGAIKNRHTIYGVAVVEEFSVEKVTVYS